MNTIFKKSVELNIKIEKFLDTISNSLLLFEKSIILYLNKDYKTFEDTLKRIAFLESEADELEADIKIMLYKFMLLPDARADVLSLIKSLDNIIDATEEITTDFNIQKPNFPITLHQSIFDLLSNTIKSAESLLLATTAFFTEVHLAASYISKINFYEHETDILEDKINNTIFNGDIITNLAEKIQLNNFINKIAWISDESEKIGEKLTIFTIKREI